MGGQQHLLLGTRQFAYLFANAGYNGGLVNSLIGTGYVGNNRPLLTGTGCNVRREGESDPEC